MRKIIILIFLLIPVALMIGFLIAFIYYDSGTGTCDSDLWKYVYSSDRLEVKQECIMVSGVIQLVREEPDGDVHIRLKLDDEYSELINEKNIEKQYGDMILEPVCQHFSLLPGAIESCKGFDKKIRIPFVGSHVTVTGAYVLDSTHGWMEIHPVTSIKISWIKTVKYWLNF